MYNQVSRVLKKKTEKSVLDPTVANIASLRDLRQ